MNDITDSFLNFNHEIHRLGKDCSIESVTLSHDAYERLKMRVNELPTSYKTLEIFGVKIFQAPRICKHEPGPVGYFDVSQTEKAYAYLEKCKHCGIKLKLKWEVI